MMAVSLPASLSLSEGRKQTRKTLLDIAGADSVDFILLNLRKKPQTGECVFRSVEWQFELYFITFPFQILLGMQCAGAA